MKFRGTFFLSLLTLALAACGSDGGGEIPLDTGNGGSSASGGSQSGGSSGSGNAGTNSTGGAGAAGSSGNSGTAGTGGSQAGAAGSTGATGGSEGGTSGVGGSTAGTAGSSGTSGNSGTSGSSGSAGTMGGSAGDAGTAGSGADAGTAGTSGTSGSSGTAGTAGTGGAPEDCQNGIDDNDDGLIDCQDPQCVAVTKCVTLPQDWLGPVIVYQGPEANQPACSGSYALPEYSGNLNFSAQPHTCSQCNCSQPVYTGCDIDTTFLIHDAPCGTQGNCLGSIDAPTGWNGTCTSKDGDTGQDVYLAAQTTCGSNPGPMCTLGTAACNVSVSTAAVAATGGTCTASGGSVQPTSVTGDVGVACGMSALPPAGGCTSGKVCLPKSASPFQTGICVYKMGEQSCPSGFPNRHVYYESFIDSRDCTSCSCGDALGGTCAATAGVYAIASPGVCTTPLVTFPAGGCGNLTGNPDVYGRKVTVTGGGSGGQCPFSGGVPLGTVDEDPASATTFCCTL